MSDFWLIALATLGSFFAGFIDAVVGGGGLIQVPLLFILFPSTLHTNIIATNRFASIAGTIVAARHYLKSIKINYRYIAIAGILTAITSYAGTFLMHKIPLNIFKPVLFVLIVILTLYTFLKKEIGIKEKLQPNKRKLYFLFAAIGIILGLYNGTIGPGTGTLLVFALVQFVGFNFLKASAYAKVINAIADGASLIAFLLQKAVLFNIALPMLAANMLGAYVGSKMAIKRGNQFIRIFFILVMLILLSKLGWDILHTPN
ncbi:MAG: TSUP family transporter [Chitinophagaceae bacterium]|nr:TSUP family transporter [Chitinophagaceae bacterium]